MKRSQPKYGSIHTDGPSKVLTLLVYMNDAWDAPAAGRLRVLYDGKNYEPFAVEVPPTMGTMFAFLRADNSWHGHEPFEGERRVVQVAWLKDAIGTGAQAQAQPHGPVPEGDLRPLIFFTMREGVMGAIVLADPAVDTGERRPAPLRRPRRSSSSAGAALFAYCAAYLTEDMPFRTASVRTSPRPHPPSHPRTCPAASSWSPRPIRRIRPTWYPSSRR